MTTTVHRRYLFFHFIFFVFFKCAVSMDIRPTNLPVTDLQPKYCRDRGSIRSTFHYRISTCSECYLYLFIRNPVFRKISVTWRNENITFLRNKKGDIRSLPDITNTTSMNEVCHTIKGEQYDCEDWKKCCSSAWKCCEKQLENPTNPGHAQCPQTWDGWACWDFTDKGTTTNQVCPSFLKYIILEMNPKVTKQCTINGTWWIDPTSHKERSDYTTCVPTEYLSLLKVYKNSIIVGISLNAFGILLLIPAIIVFIFYRQLRRQLRIRIHIHLFISLLVYGVIWMFWDVLVKYNRLVNDGTHSLVHTDQNSCKFLNILRRFARITPFFWMLCEGFFLHTLLMKAFEPPKHIIGYYFVGWGCPAFFAILYGILRKTLADDQSCWIQPPEGATGGIEWIITAPMLICIVINLFLMLNIIRIVIRQVSSHPQEPRSYRQAIKATFILVPLFGVHVFFIIYLVPPDQKAFDFFQMASTIVYNSQGIIISLIYCYFNGEVSSLIKASYRIRRDSAFIGDSRRSLTYQSNLRRLSNVSTDVQNGGQPSRTALRRSSSGSLCPNGDQNDSNHIRLSVIRENGHASENGHIHSERIISENENKRKNGNKRENGKICENGTIGENANGCVNHTICDDNDM
ncbi:calcitonin gene-related peptide type 1 receptor-like [Pecten maximus]|uniref:calcitonin gene-related peptide type 1 receptor-like n=1 Tax=Pecten maximus TaxID=6579 RepID=UPI001458046A|nr:calcitonin gene-related peptide type 1 receptor-like [Pecten maximus]